MMQCDPGAFVWIRLAAAGPPLPSALVHVIPVPLANAADPETATA
jgi:hypothetical protein